MAIRGLSDLVEFSLFAERIGGRDHLASAHGGLLLRLLGLNICRLKLHLLLLAEGHLALVVDDLLVSAVTLISLCELVGVILIKFVEKLTHNVFGLRLVNFLALFAIEWQSNLSLVWLHARHGEHEACQRLFVLL